MVVASYVAPEEKPVFGRSPTATSVWLSILAKTDPVAALAWFTLFACLLRKAVVEDETDVVSVMGLSPGRRRHHRPVMVNESLTAKTFRKSRAVSGPVRAPSRQIRSQ